jgi:4-hydroxy-tetrahydrodipicolinate synthase
MYELAKAKQFEPAMALQYRLLELFDAMIYSADFPEGFRAAVELRGFAMGKGRQPLSATQQIDRMKLQQVLRCILADFGYVETPPEGCPPKRGDLEPLRVRKIADEVVNELRKKGLV